MQFERALIHERQAEGISAVKARGAYQGRQPKLDAEQIELAHQRIAAGVPKALVARDLWCRSLDLVPGAEVVVERRRGEPGSGVGVRVEAGGEVVPGH